jgi:hypothetical protein
MQIQECFEMFWPYLASKLECNLYTYTQNNLRVITKSHTNVSCVLTTHSQAPW